MPRSLSLGNGGFLINLDQDALVRDLYFPYVGLENHVGGELSHRVGVFVDGRLSWLNESGWEVVVKSEDNILAGKTMARHEALGVSLFFTDLVYNEKNIFIRKVVVKNLRPDRARSIKIFFHHQFEIYESRKAHTAYFDPGTKTIIHYRNQRAFLVCAELEGRRFDDYSTGVFGSEGKEGTHRDAEDGLLARNNIEHGQADSVLGLTTEFAPLEEKILYYWLAVGYSIKEVKELNRYVEEVGPGHLTETTRNFWRAWVTRRNFSFHGLSDEVVRLFNKSLLVLRSHTGSNGAIIASSDSDIMQNGKDNYAYVWPRDAAYAAQALSLVGDTGVARAFFSFCNQVITDDGYFMHKYSPDGSLGSSWHPWLRNGEPTLPIQEDGTALILSALWRYYEISKDLEFVESIYNSLIKRAADFMVLFRDEQTSLPRPSYDLWEEKFGSHTFTAASVYGGLTAAANFAGLLGKVKSEKVYREAAEAIHTAILGHLYDEDRGVFYKSLIVKGGEIIYDTTIDVSTVYGLYTFDVLPPTDDRIKRTFETTLRSLTSGPVAGLARYQNDHYRRVAGPYPGNPWFITGLWAAQYYIRLAQREEDLSSVKRWLEWCVRYASGSGLLSEQIDPVNGAPLSVAPLVWSHAEFVRTVVEYLDKLESLGVCRACNPVY